MPTFTDLYEGRVDKLLVAVKIPSMQIQGVYEMNREELLRIMERERLELEEFIKATMGDSDKDRLKGKPSDKEVLAVFEDGGVEVRPYIVPLWLAGKQPVQAVHEVVLE